MRPGIKTAIGWKALEKDIVNKKGKVMITGVAIKFDDQVVSLPRPNRHHDIFASSACPPMGSYKTHIQGFMNDKGEFLDRKASFLEAKSSHQIIKKGPPYRTLFSEDIW